MSKKMSGPQKINMEKCHFWFLLHCALKNEIIKMGCLHNIFLAIFEIARFLLTIC
jgi:hypothetical protein